ncbi:alpha/beta fold hydrolase [Vibrio sp. 99-8-1]|nr:alpha/beta fold hydrolase [Vibrio sp. 99-8-1]
MLMQEEWYSNKMENQVAKLWQQRDEGYIQGCADKQLYWVSLTAPHHTKAVIVVNGRIESAWKYQELFYDLYQKGFDVYSFDHRGQGLSERLIENPQMGYVDYFDDYVDDMASVLANVDLSGYQQRHILAHSMGGAVATRYLQRYSTISFNSIALSAPMFGVDIKWYLRPIVTYLIPVIVTLYTKPFYLTENRDYYPKPFEINPLTSSSLRYHWFRQLYEAKPEMKLGGPSARWIWQALSAAKQCTFEAKKIDIPLLLLQGSQDKIVSNSAQDTFITALKTTNNDSELKIIDGSKHEILFESDTIRESALEQVFAFFEDTKRGK